MPAMGSYASTRLVCSVARFGALLTHPDGRTRFLQGEAVYRLLDELDATEDEHGYDRVLDQYFCLFENEE